MHVGVLKIFVQIVPIFKRISKASGSLIDIGGFFRPAKNLKVWLLKSYCNVTSMMSRRRIRVPNERNVV